METEPAFGVGYAYEIDTFTIDSSFMVLPYIYANDGAIGGRAGVTWWFNDDEDIGITLRADYYKLIIADASAFLIRIGISTRVGWD
jgi:hypothetical protein